MLDLILTIDPPGFPVSPLGLASEHDGVAALVDPDRAWGNEHDRASRDQLLVQIAAFLGVPVLPPITALSTAGPRTLLVPNEALLAAGTGDMARPLLGGVVPASFVGTKAISHGLVDPDAARPSAWSTRMADLLGDAALPGYTAFTLADAARAGRRLLERGAVRIKDVCGKAGLGQTVVRDAAALDAALATEDPAALAEHGIVLEQNLTDVVTYSVGCTQLGSASIGYWGSQNLTTDHRGREVYGGSDLFVVRGGLDEVRALDLPAGLSRAVDCAAAFDRAAHLAYPGLQVTRRNYDVIEGLDGAGQRRIGVLEQSWRVGGASGAEIAAFDALRGEPDTPHVRCSTIELYELVTPPPGAVVYYRGIDPKVGALTKYAVRLA